MTSRRAKKRRVIIARLTDDPGRGKGSGTIAKLGLGLQHRKVNRTLDQ